MKYTFNPTLVNEGEMPKFSTSIIKEEPMMFSADKDFAFKNGGEITKYFIQEFLNDDLPWIIDSRVHMLMPGWYPCIPGWHHDDVPRYTTPGGQPDYDNLRYKASHKLCVIGDASLTQFYKKPIELEKPKPGEVYYKIWNDEINKVLTPEDIYTVDSGEVVSFDWQTFHRGMPSTKSDWRYFVRASVDTFRQFHNQVRKQVQAYMPAIEGGW